MSSVSRSKYQKLAEENKRLWKDLEIICTGDSFESIEKRQAYRKYFDGKNAFFDQLKLVALKLDAIKRPVKSNRKPNATKTTRK